MLASLGAGGRLLLQYLLIVWLVATAWRVARRVAGDERGPRVAVAGVVFFSVNVLLIAVPGVLGWLTAPVVALLAAGYCLAVQRWLPAANHAAATQSVVTGDVQTPSRADEPAAEGRISQLLLAHAMLLCVPFVVLTVPHVLRALLLVPVDWDSHCYHLFLPVHWIQQHRISVFEAPLPYTYFSFYSKNFECTLTLSMLLASNDLLAKWFTWPCVALCGLVTGLICRQLGGHRLACWAAAATMLTTTNLVVMSATTKPDPMVIFAVASALWLLLRAIQNQAPPRREPRPLLFVAGMACGLAIGGKFTALLPVLVMCLAVPFLAYRSTGSLRGAVQGTLLFAAGAILIGGWWYGWSFWITGNPIYPTSVGPFVGIKDEGWHNSILNNLHKLPRFWEFWDASVYGSELEPGPASMTYGRKFYLLFALLVVALFGGLLRSLKLLRQRNIVAAVAWSLTLACMLAALYTYFRAPYWRPVYFPSVVRVSLPVFAFASAAGFALLSHPRVHPVWFWLLPLTGVVLDESLMDFRLPDASGAIPVVLFAGICAALLLRFRADRRIGLAVIVAAGLLLPSLHAYREAHRYADYRDWAEVHSSGYQRFASGAAWLQRSHPNAPAAVAFGTDYEFLYLYVGPNLQRRVDYIPAIKTPRPSWKSNGDVRTGLDATAWRARVANGRDEFLICHRWTRRLWPAERYWAQESRMPVVFESEFMEIYELHASRLSGSLNAPSASDGRVAL